MWQTSQFESLSREQTRLHLNIIPADPSAGWFTKLMGRLFAGYEKYVFKRLMRFIENGG